MKGSNASCIDSCGKLKAKAGDEMERKLEIDKSADVIRLEGVSFSYNGTPVLRNINLLVEKGEFLAILGPNGSAKSTLLKIMLGLLAPKAGEAKIFGRKIKNFKEWNKIGYISQHASNTNISFPATVMEIVSSGYYPGFGKIFNKSKIKEAAENALKEVGISHLATKLLGHLSGGQRQKVFLARALVKKPEALFLDEPTTGIDAASQREFYELLDKFHKEGGTVVMVTHEVDAALRLADKVGYMEDGEISVYENNDSLSKILAYRLLGKSARRGI